MCFCVVWPKNILNAFVDGYYYKKTYFRSKNVFLPRGYHILDRPKSASNFYGEKWTPCILLCFCVVWPKNVLNACVDGYFCKKPYFRSKTVFLPRGYHILYLPKSVSNFLGEKWTPCILVCFCVVWPKNVLNAFVDGYYCKKTYFRSKNVFLPRGYHIIDCPKPASNFYGEKWTPCILLCFRVVFPKNILNPT